MASQPLPTIGSITFLVHLLIIFFYWLKKVNKIILSTTAAIVILFISFNFYSKYQPNNHFYSPIPTTQPEDKHKNEKTEPINDISFVKNLHFSAWIPWWDEERVIKSLETIPHGYVESISPLWYNLSKEGKIQSNPGSSLRSNILSLALNSNMDVIPGINNESDATFDGERVTEFLNTKELQTQFITDAINLAEENGFKGWDIDWEQKSNGDRKAFSEFIKYASEEFHKNDLKLTVSVQAKTSDTETEDDNGAEDWKSLAKYADQIRVMAYDFHYDTSDPGAITPLDDLEAVLDYALETIPREKISLGVPLYGYDWDKNKGEAIQHEDAKLRIEQNKGTEFRDPASEELVGRYGSILDPHTLWFMDQKSVLRILYIANNYEIKNISFWRLGGEDSKVWDLKN